MKERPILFSAPMVRALLDGSKTQTRRVVKPAPGDVPGTMRHPDVAIFGALAHAAYGDEWRCPYGQPGERLWVREAWQHQEGGAIYDAAGGVADAFESETVYRASRPHYPGPWKPSIHMPRGASRIDLEIVDVRVERLQNISEADAIAEGIGLNPSAVGVRMSGDNPEPMAVAMYRALWEQINGAGSWDANPWVWAVSFKVVRP